MKQLGSSKGFSKRTLLRPASGLNKERQFLKTVDISQSEQMISSTIRSELSVIQQSISLLDKDKRIRSSEQSLEKSYIGVLKKWIRENGSLAAHFEKEDDDKVVLKHMGVQSYEAGFRKLWKINCNLDLMISKIMELEIVHLVKYDQMFDKIGQDSQIASGMLSGISKAGFNPAMFHVVRVSLERSNQLYAYVSDIKKKNPTAISANQNQQTNELIEKLKGENKKLTDLIGELQRHPHQSHAEQHPPTKRHPGSVQQIEDKYKELVEELNAKIAKLNEQHTENQLQIHSLQKKLDLTEKELNDLKNQSNLQRRSVKPGSYQEALVQEMDKMKNGFERKIKRIQQEHQKYEREQRRRQYEYKGECDRMKWQKSLLLKKFDILSNS